MAAGEKAPVLSGSRSSADSAGGDAFRQVIQVEGGESGCGGRLVRLCKKEEEVSHAPKAEEIARSISEAIYVQPACRSLATSHAGAVPSLQGTFSSSLGVMLSMMGSVVGTGNIWRFPRIVANHAEHGGKRSTARYLHVYKCMYML